MAATGIAGGAANFRPAGPHGTLKGDEFTTLHPRVPATASRGCCRPSSAACLLAGPSAAAATATENLYREAKELRAKYAEDLEKLAAWCDQEGLAAEAKQTRAAPGPHDPYKLYVPVLPHRAGPPKLPAGAVPVLIQWHERFSKLRQEQAAALYALAQRAMHRHQPSLAYTLVLEAIGADPDHEAARRLLGYQKYEGLWRTAFEVKKLRAGQVWDEKFGWLPEAQLARYQQGQRLVGDRWITAEEDARRHRDIHSPWRVETEHYAIRTDHSLEAAVGLGVKLEHLYRIWEQIYIRFYANEAYVAGLFSGHPTGLAAQARELHRFNVVYFRDRDEYCRSLRGAMPRPDIALGIYLYEERRPISSPAKRATTAPSITRPRTSSSTSRGGSRRNWAARAISGSSRGRPSTWSRSAKRTATSCSAAWKTPASTPPATTS